MFEKEEWKQGKRISFWKLISKEASEEAATNIDMKHIQYQGETLPPFPFPPGISLSPGIR